MSREQNRKDFPECIDPVAWYTEAFGAVKVTLLKRPGKCVGEEERGTWVQPTVEVKKNELGPDHRKNASRVRVLERLGDTTTRQDKTEAS